METKLDNYIRIRQAILNKSWKQLPTKEQLYGYLPPVTKTIKIRRTRHAGHCCRSRDELVSRVLLWTPSQGRANAKHPTRTHIQQLCADTGCSPEDLPKEMDGRERWRERVRNICTNSATWWWWWWSMIETFQSYTITKTLLTKCLSFWYPVFKRFQNKSSISNPALHVTREPFDRSRMRLTLQFNVF